MLIAKSSKKAYFSSNEAEDDLLLKKLVPFGIKFHPFRSAVIYKCIVDTPM